MSKLMDDAVINMPYEIAMSDDISRRQFYYRAQAVLKERDEALAKLAAIESELSSLPAKWSEDSSLETWFPLTSEELESLREEVSELRAYKEAAEKQEPSCWRITHRSFCGIVTEKKEIAEDPFYSGCVFPLYAKPVPADKPAVAVPDDVGMIPMINGKPEVTGRMKVECIGEFSWREEAPYYDENGELHDHVATHEVPWDVCKEIYKRMASAALLAVPSHSQQSVVCGYLISDGFTEQFVKTLSDEDRKAAQRFNWDVIAVCRCPSHESEQGGES